MTTEKSDDYAQVENRLASATPVIDSIWEAKKRLFSTTGSAPTRIRLGRAAYAALCKEVELMLQVPLSSPKSFGQNFWHRGELFGMKIERMADDYPPQWLMVSTQ